MISRVQTKEVSRGKVVQRASQIYDEKIKLFVKITHVKIVYYLTSLTKGLSSSKKTASLNMTLIFKASLLIQGRLLQTSSIKKYLITSLSSKYIKQVDNKFNTQVRFYSSNDKNLPPQSRERLYDGMLHKKIRLVKVFSLMTSAGSLLCQPYLISKALETGSKITAGGIFFTFGFFAFVTPVMLHMITKRYVIHVDYNPEKDTYIASTYSIFAQKKEVEFRPEDVDLPNMSDMLTTCTIKGSPMFMDVQLFTDINHYKRIMGFDKPIDFNLNTKDIESRKNSW